MKQLWPFLLKFFGDVRIFYIVYLLILSSGIFLLGALIIWYISLKKIKFIEQFRIQNKPWPWEQDKEAWNKLFNKTLLNVLFNLFILGGGFALLDILYFNFEIKFDMESFPSYFEIFFQVMCCLNIHEFAFYWVHRLAHNKLFYPYIHKVHHQYYQNVTLAGQYFHPIDFIQSILISGIFGRKLLFGNIHFISFSLWIGIMNFSAMDDHCGYEFPWSPLSWSKLFVGPQYHDYHHSHNVGCYSAIFSYWDYICNTNKEYLEYINDEDNDSKKEK